jgi:hypothetical protein
MKLMLLSLAAVAITFGAGPSAEPKGNGTKVDTKNCLKVLRRDGNYLVCPNSDGTHTVYKVKPFSSKG